MKKAYEKPLAIKVEREKTIEKKDNPVMYLADGRWCCIMPQ